MPEQLTAAEKRIESLLRRGYHISNRGNCRTAALLPPGVVNCWDSSDTVWVRASTLANLKRKLTAANTPQEH